MLVRWGGQAMKLTGAAALCALVAAPSSLVKAAHAGVQSTRNMVKLLTLNPLDVLYVLLGGGGNALTLMRTDEIVLVDAKLPGWGRAILDAVEAVSDRPVTTMIYTHAHPDHVGGSTEFSKVTQIIAHENTRIAMQKMAAFGGANAKFLPNRIVTDRLSLFDGPDRIELYYFGAGHTSGDLVVVWPTKRVAYLGDLFPSKAAPVIDSANGGSGVAFPQTLARVLSEIKGVARVVTGHEQGLGTERSANPASVDISTPQTMTWADLHEYADFARDFLAAVRASIAARKTAEEAAATLNLPDRYKNYDMRQAKAYVDAVYKELAGR